MNIARLYYEHNYSQQMIADKLELSRPYVSKLINEARESGIVEIRIHDPNGAETRVESEIKSRFGLKKAVAIPSHGPGEDVLNKLGSAAARLLDSIIKDGDIIGVALGIHLVCMFKKHNSKG